LLRAQKFVIASVLYNKDYVKDILDDLFIKNEKINKFYEFILQNRGNKISVSSEILANFDLENNPDLLDIVNYNFDAYKQNAKEYYIDCLTTIKSEKLKNDIKDINEKIKNCTDENDKKTLINTLTLLQSQLYRK
jgi:hypothetical protein